MSSAASTPVIQTFRLRAYIISACYATPPLFAGAVLLTLVATAPTEIAAGAALVGVTFVGVVATVITHVAITDRHLPRSQSWQRLRPLLIGGGALVGLVALALALLMGSDGVRAGLVLIGSLILTGLVPQLTWRQLLVTGAALLLAGIVIALAVPPYELGAAIATSWIILVLLAAWANVWMLRVVDELEEARVRAAASAVIEERLRISRDLHDVFGRTLATVAVKSELAAQLVRKGRPDDALAELAAVRSIATDVGTQVRSVVSGDQHPDLVRELAGAAALLESAGIGCEVSAPAAAELPQAMSEVLAWVVREAVTNVIRHSRATWTTVALTESDGGTGPWTLTVRNDGAVGGDVLAPGTGLAGMRRRLEAVRGSVETRPGETFTLIATVAR